MYPNLSFRKDRFIQYVFNTYLIHLSFLQFTIYCVMYLSKFQLILHLGNWHFPLFVSQPSSQKNVIGFIVLKNRWCQRKISVVIFLFNSNILIPHSSGPPPPFSIQRSLRTATCPNSLDHAEVLSTFSTRRYLGGARYISGVRGVASICWRDSLTRDKRSSSPSVFTLDSPFIVSVETKYGLNPVLSLTNEFLRTMWPFLDLDDFSVLPPEHNRRYVSCPHWQLTIFLRHTVLFTANFSNEFGRTSSKTAGHLSKTVKNESWPTINNHFMR